ncbi:hypothetical protein ACFYRN_16470 [Streptomyces sp. NPDC005227]|uniref:hypothetical protein n=1 Tax=Streptomyces sp. NPDC005227 TaxID=3364707 RepID=UPI0036B9AEA2
MSTLRIETPLPTAPPRPTFERHAWETALLTSGIGHDDRALGMVLAHLADERGEMPAGGPQRAGRLANLTRLKCQRIREGLVSLENRHFLTRPDQREWMADPQKNVKVRPITLTMPLPSGTRRPHISAVPE